MFNVYVAYKKLCVALARFNDPFFGVFIMLPGQYFTST